MTPTPAVLLTVFFLWTLPASLAAISYRRREGDQLLDRTDSSLSGGRDRAVGSTTGASTLTQAGDVSVSDESLR